MPLRTIPKSALLRLEELRELLDVKPSTLKREVREGRLRVSRRAGCYWTTGLWVREWIEGGEKSKCVA
jgi:hypothetical protein